VDLSDERGESTDRVLARAMSRSFAGVIFTAAQNECPSRRLGLRRADEGMMDSVENS
jgi:hypothetical protein